MTRNEKESGVVKTPDHGEQCRCEERVCLADVWCTLLCGQGKLWITVVDVCEAAECLARSVRFGTYSTGTHCLNE